MWFQWSMKHFLRNFTWWCGSLSLLLGLPSSEIMCYGVLLLCWFGLFFGTNWDFIEFLQTQSDGLVEVLYFYGDNSYCIGCYVTRMTSRYITGSKSMLPQTWSWWHPWWIWMSAMWYIWRFIVPSRIWIHWSYYLCRYCRFGIQNKEVSLLKLNGHGDISFSHLWQWICLPMFFQQWRLYEYWREDIPKKTQMHSKRPWYF